MLNRGTYRQGLFETADMAAGFYRMRSEVCECMRWRLFAWVLMNSHYHLAIQTSEPEIGGDHRARGTIRILET